jgi:aconitase B
MLVQYKKTNMKIYLDSNEVEIKNITFKNYGDDVSNLKNRLEKIVIDFKSIHLLRGNKDILEQAFKEIKEG